MMFTDSCFVFVLVAPAHSTVAFLQISSVVSTLPNIETTPYDLCPYRVTTIIKRMEEHINVMGFYDEISEAIDLRRGMTRSKERRKKKNEEKKLIS